MMNETKTTAETSKGYAKDSEDPQKNSIETSKGDIELLNLLSEIIIEIIIRELNERNRIHTKK